jgi:hypothetical protein
MPNLPTTSVAQWLEDQKDGLSISGGSFSVDSWNARRLGGYPSLGLSDVPLLLMAGAVEGQSSYVRLHGARNCLIEWDGQAGPAYDLALSVLHTQGVDFRAVDRRAVELPEVYWDLLEPFYLRCRHAPLSVVRGDRLLWSHQPGNGVWAVTTNRPRLLVCDRGVDFELPFALPGLKVVSRVASPLLGNPWPIRLVWNDELVQTLLEVTRWVGFSSRHLR